MIIDEPTDNDLLTYENLLDDDINSDRRKIKLVDLNSSDDMTDDMSQQHNYQVDQQQAEEGEGEEEGEEEEEEEEEPANIDDTDMILNTENTDYDNIDYAQQQEPNEEEEEEEADADQTNNIEYSEYIEPAKQTWVIENWILELL